MTQLLDKTSESMAPTSSPGEDSLETLLRGKSHRLKVRLDVVACEIHDRFRIRDSNLSRIEADRLSITNILLYFHPRYGPGVPPDPHLHTNLYRGYLDLNREQRQQDVDCWRDVAHVMREFLEVWDSYQEAKGRAAFLKIR